MTKKKIAPVRKYEPVKFKVEETLLKCQPKSMPANLTEEKEKFLRSGKAPKFDVKDRAMLDELASKTKNQIRFELFGEAQYILDKVHDTYGSGEYFLEHAFGIRITKEEATSMLLKYIAENPLMESMKIHWCDNLACSAKLVWTGPVVNANRPDLRKYSLWINGSQENNYMRESGIRCLMDHEIGTHFFRSFNDGFQPWFSERERFGLRKMGTFEGQCTEEGLAAINTVLRGRVKYLWGAALAYYTACKATEMTFKQLFDHLGYYISNPEYRWKQAMRVKRGLADPNDLGGFGNDQCYFEGAVNILRNMEKIDFYLLMTGKICFDELDRIKRVARKDVVRFPSFMKNMTLYRKTLSKIMALNCLNGLHPQRGPPDVYIKRLDERKHGKKSQKTRKVRVNSKLTFLAKKIANNKKASKKPAVCDDDNNNEVESFKCEQPFVNFHLRTKNSPEDVFQTSEAVVSTVTQISNDIVIKDTSLDEQIQKLQGIFHEHSWTCQDEDYKHSLIKEAERELNGLTCCEISGTYSQMSFREDNDSTFCNSIALDDDVSSVPTNLSVDCETPIPLTDREKKSCDSALDQDNRKSPETDSKISRSSSDVSLFKDKNCNKATDLSGRTSPKTSNDPSPSKDTSFASRNKHGLLPKRRMTYGQMGRKLLRTPVAEITSNESIQMPYRPRLPVESVLTKKRGSLQATSQKDLTTDDLQNDEYRNNSLMWCKQPKPTSSNCFDKENIFVRDSRKTNELPASKIKVDALDLTNSQDFLPRTVGLKYQRQGSNFSTLSVSSEIDFESFLRAKHAVFPSYVNKRKIPVSCRPPMTNVEFVNERSRPTVAPFQSKNEYVHAAELSDVENSLNHESFYQPMIISSAKPLVQKGLCRNKYPCV